ncbi:hypothetical protein E2C01_004840 [Portunus trituberculatus]|uniref:Uncharacterized protein n=1 Tax=Portunus trituberculatus TaxID=210409 RepID=A0A5B7CR25_PORTR|nr:hypothetical protein [Portunus trituberculatus]
MQLHNTNKTIKMSLHAENGSGTGSKRTAMQDSQWSFLLQHQLRHLGQSFQGRVIIALGSNAKGTISHSYELGGVINGLLEGAYLVPAQFCPLRIDKFYNKGSTVPQTPHVNILSAR